MAGTLLLSFFINKGTTYTLSGEKPFLSKGFYASKAVVFFPLHTEFCVIWSTGPSSRAFSSDS
jgi:hypothetical protein